MSFDERIRKLNEVQRGWVNAFRMASIQNKLNELDGVVTKPSPLLHLASLEGRLLRICPVGKFKEEPVCRVGNGKDEV